MSSDFIGRRRCHAPFGCGLVGKNGNNERREGYDESQSLRASVAVSRWEVERIRTLTCEIARAGGWVLQRCMALAMACKLGSPVALGVNNSSGTTTAVDPVDYRAL